MIAIRRASQVERSLECLARDTRPIVLGPWLGEVGFELLYWIPFLRWFAERYNVPPERLIAVSRGGAATWYAPFASRSYDALAFMSQEEFRRKNADRSGYLGEQKQIASTPLDDEIVAVVRQREQTDVVVLHPSTMYRLFAPYWWGHRPIAWIHQYAHFTPMRPPSLAAELPADYTAVKFYFNDCFRNTPENRAFVDDTIRGLVEEGAVISLSTGVAVDDHAPCESDVAAMHEIRHLLAPQSNLIVQSAIVAGARRFVGTYGGFAYLAPLCGVPAVSYYSEAGSFSTRHLDLMRDVLRSTGDAGSLELIQVPQEGGR
ncbi:MAG TPA: hypothetical protein VIK60_01445 [Vicinamibacterales bacterium]